MSWADYFSAKQQLGRELLLVYSLPMPLANLCFISRLKANEAKLTLA
jgi:hypothetical protein